MIDDYGDQATVSGIMDGDPDKIPTSRSKDKNRGFFGRVTGGYGTEERYQGSFNGNYFQNKYTDIGAGQQQQYQHLALISTEAETAAPPA